MKHSLRTIMLVAALTGGSGSLRELAAETAAECRDRTVQECAEAMEDASWARKWALGVICTGLLLACNFSV